MENNKILAKTTLSIKFYQKNSAFGHRLGKWEPEMALEIIVNGNLIEYVYPSKKESREFEEYKNYITQKVYIPSRYEDGSRSDFEDNIKVVIGTWSDETFYKPVSKNSFIENTFNFFEEKLKINKNFIEQKLLTKKLESGIDGGKATFAKEYFYELDPRLEINNESIVNIIHSVDDRKKALEQSFEEKEAELVKKADDLKEKLQAKFENKEKKLLEEFQNKENLLTEREKLLEQKEEKLLTGFQTSFKGLNYKNLNDLQAAKFLTDDEKRIICGLLPKQSKE
jgi:hypothetical protein